MAGAAPSTLLSRPPLTLRRAQNGGGNAIGLAFFINSFNTSNAVGDGYYGAYGSSDWDIALFRWDNTTNTTIRYGGDSGLYSLNPCVDGDELRTYLAPRLNGTERVVGNDTWWEYHANTKNVSVAPGILAAGNNFLGAAQVWTTVYRPYTDAFTSFTFSMDQLNTLCSTWQAAHADCLGTCPGEGTQISYSSCDAATAAPPPPACTAFICPNPPPSPPPSPPSTACTYTTVPANLTADYVTVIAYSGTIRSKPRVVRSNSSALTGTLNAPSFTGIAKTLMLLANYKAGTLTALEWQDMGDCPGCTDSCMNVGPSDTSPGSTDDACAYSWDTCLNNTSVNSVGNVTVNTSVCPFNVYLGFLGTDASSRPFKSGPQIQYLRKYSVSAIFAQGVSYAKYAKGVVVANVATNSSVGGKDVTGRRLLELGVAAAGGVAEAARGAVQGGLRRVLGWGGAEL